MTHKHKHKTHKQTNYKVEEYPKRRYTTLAEMHTNAWMFNADLMLLRERECESGSLYGQ